MVLALGVLLIFAGVVWNTYRQGVRSAEGGLPIIASDTGPYKRSPDARGGVEVAGQDKAYYDSMDGLGDPAVQKTAARNPIDIRRRDPQLEGGPQSAPQNAEEAPPIVFGEATTTAPTPPSRTPQIANVQPVPQPVTPSPETVEVES